MAADQTSSWGCGKFQDSPGWELPESLPPPGFNVTDKQDCTSETWHVAFRAFASSEEADPIKDLQRLRELCHLWLRPDIHTKEQILDKLVMEQFMISMPLELQVLVKESGVESCQDLEDMLRNNEKSEKWTVVSLQGQKFLVRSSDVQMAQAEVSDMDSIRDMSRKAWSSGSDMEIHPENSPEVLRELQNLPRINEMSREQYKSQLSIHQKKHTGERPFKCTLCLKGFVQSSDLRAHQRIHTGEKPYSCRFCLKQFTHDSTLRSHERVHTNEKPYQCEVCDKHFNHKGNLNVHLRTHSGVKPYPCDQCDQAFRQLGTFKRHQKTHLKVTSPNSA
ncbi:PREDICTED: zinc finger and SCAN domain-containing protein 5B [Hipposideros armiger]|uniref:Zinc finger and SCAN domain-containing protein 5B n=1 Tax=Hipposideros armiger TaxID=186990 RepID=A0A8B7Q6V7_HIPAR|nr:PREDICTED: zinc finger and SCAN domain-containing protein 5B [Hipposideros armiger]